MIAGSQRRLGTGPHTQQPDFRLLRIAVAVARRDPEAPSIIDTAKRKLENELTILRAIQAMRLSALDHGHRITLGDDGASRRLQDRLAQAKIDAAKIHEIEGALRAIAIAAAEVAKVPPIERDSGPTPETVIRASGEDYLAKLLGNDRLSRDHVRTAWKLARDHEALATAGRVSASRFDAAGRSPHSQWRVPDAPAGLDERISSIYLPWARELNRSNPANFGIAINVVADGWTLSRCAKRFHCRWITALDRFTAALDLYQLFELLADADRNVHEHRACREQNDASESQHRAVRRTAVPPFESTGETVATNRLDATMPAFTDDDEAELDRLVAEVERGGETPLIDSLVRQIKQIDRAERLGLPSSVYTVEAIAYTKRCSTKTVRRAILAGELIPISGTGRFMYFDDRTVEAWRPDGDGRKSQLN
jgi:hypothetical protein